MSHAAATAIAAGLLLGSASWRRWAESFRAGRLSDTYRRAPAVNVPLGCAVVSFAAATATAGALMLALLVCGAMCAAVGAVVWFLQPAWSCWRGRGPQAA